MRIASKKSALSTTIIAVVIVVIILIAAAGVYVAVSTKSASTVTVTSGTTATATSTATVTTQLTSSVTSSSSVTTSTSSSVLSTTPYVMGVANPSVSLGPASFLIDQSQNLFTKYDPNAQVEYFSNGATLMQALEAGTVQISANVASIIAEANDTGFDVSVVGNYFSPTPVNLWVVSATSKYTSPSQLEGLTIATGTPSSTAYADLAIYAGENGWPNVASLNLVEVATNTAQVTAVISGEAQATLITAQNYVPFDGDGLTTVIGNFSIPWPNLVIATTPSFASAHADAVRAALASVYAGDAIFNANTNNSTINLLLNEYPTTSLTGAKFDLTVQVYATNSSLSLSDYQLMINNLVQYGLMSTNFSASVELDPNFVTITK